MPTPNQQKGNRLEYAVGGTDKRPGILKANGYETFRAHGSHSKIDVVAFKRGEILFVQCKTDGRAISPADRAELRRLAGLVGAVPLLAEWYKDGRAARVVRFWRLTSSGPAGHHPWTPDYALEAS